MLQLHITCFCLVLEAFFLCRSVIVNSFLSVQAILRFLPNHSMWSMRIAGFFLAEEFRYIKDDIQNILISVDKKNCKYDEHVELSTSKNLLIHNWKY